MSDEGQGDATEDRRFWLALHRAPGLNVVELAAFLREIGGPRALFESTSAERRALGLREPTLAYLQSPDWGAVDTDIAWLEPAGRHLITCSDRSYPARLLEIDDPPLLLFVRGDADVLCSTQLAIVGSRNPTRSGRDNAFAFAKAFSELGLSIVSGLAVGIDTAAHQGALAGGGHTVAVAGNGLARVYPEVNTALSEAIARDGALVSEFAPSVPPRAANFPRRNRIISGLSVGVLVVEAAARSGSLITARLAADQGREVFAIPGSIHNPLARGCHKLLRQGAKLVETAEDIIEELGGQLSFLPPGNAQPHADSRGVEELDADYLALLEGMGYETISVDVLVERTGLTADAVSSMLLLLELNGHVISEAGGLYSRTVRKGTNTRE